MARFRPVPAGVHDSPEWKAAGGFLRTIHRILRPVTGELELPAGRPGDPAAVTLQAKLAELGAHYREEECKALVEEATGTKLWRVRGDVLLVPAFPPTFEAKCKAEGRGAQGGEGSAARMRRHRANKDLREAMASFGKDASDGELDERLARAFSKIAKDDPELAKRIARKLRGAATPEASAAPATVGGVTEGVTEASLVTLPQQPPPPPPPAPGDPFRGSRDEGGTDDTERHAVTDPGGAPDATVDPLELGRQLRDELKAAGRAFLPAAPDSELAGLAGLVRRGDFSRDNLRLVAAHWAADPDSLRSTFSTDKAMRDGAPVTLGLLLGERDAKGKYAGGGLRKALARAVVWERKEAAERPPGALKASSPVELARAEWRRDCEAREAKGYVTYRFEEWLAQGDDLHRADARAWKARAARSKPKGATG